MTEAALFEDDEDVVDFCLAAERVFGVSLGRDLRHIATFGHLHREIMAHSPAIPGAFCGTSRVFYDLRRALAIDGRRRTWPTFATLKGARASPRSLAKELALRTGWGMPQPAMSEAGCVLGLATLFAIAVFFLSGQWLVSLALVSVVPAALMLDGGSWGHAYADIGALARATAARNYATLVAAGAHHSEWTVWSVLTQLAAEAGGRRPPTADTRLLPERKR